MLKHFLRLFSCFLAHLNPFPSNDKRIQIDLKQFKVFPCFVEFFINLN